jgi:glycerol-3-phosphate dehydrogenase
VRAGAQVANYAEALDPLLDGDRLAGVKVTDHLTGESFDVRASMVINAAGACAAAVASRLARRTAAAAPMTGLALNLMLADQGLQTAFAIATRQEGRWRRLFVAPWRGRTLVGTAHYSCAQAPQTSAELEPYVERFVHEVAAAWPERPLARSDVLLVHAGMQPSPDAAEGKRHGPPSHLIVDHAAQGVPELLTAVGPKLTTSRAIAEQLLDIVCQRLGRPADASVTALRPLGTAPAMDVEVTIAHALAADNAGLPDDVVTHLVRAYGAGYTRLVDAVRDTPALAQRVEGDAPVIEAQFHYAVLHEMALRPEDLICRRTELGATACATPRALATAARVLAAADPARFS